MLRAIQRGSLIDPPTIRVARSPLARLIRFAARCLCNVLARVKLASNRKVGVTLANYVSAIASGHRWRRIHDTRRLALSWQLGINNLPVKIVCNLPSGNGCRQTSRVALRQVEATVRVMSNSVELVGNVSVCGRRRLLGQVEIDLIPQQESATWISFHETGRVPPCPLRCEGLLRKCLQQCLFGEGCMRFE